MVCVKLNSNIRPAILEENIFKSPECMLQCYPLEINASIVVLCQICLKSAQWPLRGNVLQSSALLERHDSCLMK